MSPSKPFSRAVDTRTVAAFQGHRYGPTTHDQVLSTLTGPTLTLTVPPLSIEFRVRNP
ncbi:hypothetical protein ACWC5I_37380 [Kitasatospora sp. NPDC001574]